MFGSAKDFEPVFEEMVKVRRSTAICPIFGIDFLSERYEGAL
jgi:hypothetical protein